MSLQATSRKKMIWVNIVFFAVTALVAVIGGPLYVLKYGVSLPEGLLFVFYMVATGLSITVGYHRLFSHVAYKAHPVIRFLLLFFGAAAFEQTALMWSSQHRDHHRYVDTERDPYSIKKGFWYAHVGWMLFWEHQVNYDNAGDLKKDPMVMHQHHYYLGWSVVSGILVPVFIGALTGHALGAFILAVCGRITLVYHATFCINSVCHMFGRPTYDIYATAKDHWFIAFLTYGEGYHNFHHRFPGDYRNGVRWYQWDPSKWMIWVLARLGLAERLHRVSPFRILAARLAAESQLAQDKLQTHRWQPEIEVRRALETLKLRYISLCANLAVWEKAARDSQRIFQQQVSKQSRELQCSASKKVEEAKRQFAVTHERWRELICHNPLDLRRALLLNSLG
ncbi:MAG: fatty acid desaturase [Candidatus Omnitrophota bacterium]|nr:fatty acid desaturase [Candidatus Omnitrophota bacterium]